MPECGGIEASMRIKKYLNKHMPKKAQSFICCITAYQQEKYEKQAKESGMDYFLSKPVYKQGLGQLLKEAGLINSKALPQSPQRKRNNHSS